MGERILPAGVKRRSWARRRRCGFRTGTTAGSRSTRGRCACTTRRTPYTTARIGRSVKWSARRRGPCCTFFSTGGQGRPADRLTDRLCIYATNPGGRLFYSHPPQLPRRLDSSVSSRSTTNEKQPRVSPRSSLKSRAKTWLRVRKDDPATTPTARFVFNSTQRRLFCKTAQLRYTCMMYTRGERGVGVFPSVARDK